MGCDIHIRIYVEKDGQWEHVVPPEHTDYGYRRRSWFADRNYELFGVLAGVRGDEEPITPPRGLPLCLLKGQTVEEFTSGDYDESHPESETIPWLGYHSFTFYTLDELLAARQFREDVKLSGFVSQHDYSEVLQGGTPSSFCSNVSGQMVRKISEEEMQQRIADNDFHPSLHYYAFLEWTVPSNQWFGNWIKFINSLKKLGPTSKTMIVMGFDS